ncbi:4541_t:CDS:2 [Funneliformis geosporum]|uniref:16381_t:CDS:1 n=1 Tax=Funneliformis geosporum TaxID=1117311 RepID=A0A9W4WNL3_9GLOM|nr:4541_t:CDS:2 [Funneliformis geosporum]CAI2174939.1 16381_t:CDS:2 [Funneliformis geosporum]
MVKHTKERLLEYPNIISVSDDGLTAFCKCGQNVKLGYPYNDNYLIITHGVYLSRHLLAKQLFPEKFLEKVDYRKFNQSELDLLYKEVIRKSKWHIEGETVRSTKCELYTSNILEICIECVNINNDQVFRNALNKKPIKPSNIKHIPKIILNENPISKFLFNKDIFTLMEILGTQNSEC